MRDVVIKVGFEDIDGDDNGADMMVVTADVVP